MIWLKNSILLRKLTLTIRHVTKTKYSSMVTTSTTDSENERLEIIKDSESENGSGKLNKMAASQV